jgi:hypothetical protein
LSRRLWATKVGLMEDWIDTAGLIALAVENGYKVSARSLELWRYRGLLPRGRQPKGRAAWLYPPASEPQLLRLLHWREKTRSLDLILVVLWIEGFQINIADARPSLHRFVDALERTVARELKDADDLSAAIDALARKLVGKRGKTAIPRVARMTADERTRAFAYALAFAFNAEDEIARRKGDAVLLERLLGFRTGRSGGLAAIMPLDEDTLRIAGLRSPAKLRTVLDSATDDEFEFVRRIVHVVAVWTPLLIPKFVEQYGAKATPVVEFARKLLDGLHPDYYGFAVIAMLTSLHAKGQAAGELRGQLETITPAAINLDLLASLPTDQRLPALKVLPPGDQREVASELARRKKSTG